jgi:hypothetical protein
MYYRPYQYEKTLDKQMVLILGQNKSTGCFFDSLTALGSIHLFLKKFDEAQTHFGATCQSFWVLLYMHIVGLYEILGVYYKPKICITRHLLQAPNTSIYN